MKSSLYQSLVPTSLRALNNLAAILDIAATHAGTHKLVPAALLDARLFPDMLPFIKQIQIATDTASGGVARLAGTEIPAFEHSESSFAELTARVRKTIAYLETIQAPQLDGSEDKTVTWQTRSSTKSMQGHAYVFNHVLPNLFFHVTTAYNILRHNGVALGKMDFLGRS